MKSWTTTYTCSCCSSFKTVYTPKHTHTHTHTHNMVHTYETQTKHTHHSKHA